METLERERIDVDDQIVSVSPIGDGIVGQRLRTPGPLNRRASEPGDKRLVAETLRWCAGTFGTQRARFVRRLADGTWIVQTLVEGTAVSQPADRAEIAMAWFVGLSRNPVLVTRPRVTTFEGDGVRPIAVTRYIGIPIVCQDEFLGIIELAGSIGSELDLALDESESRLAWFAERLLYDPSLRPEPQGVPDETVCEINGAPGATGYITLSDEEWELVAVLDGPLRFDEIAARVSISDEQLPAVARALVTRGLITLRTPTGPLSDLSSMTVDPPTVSESTEDAYTSYGDTHSD